MGMQPGLFSLLPQVADAVSVPVIAAGGIADGRGVAAALMLGASAVQVGTAFLRCEEANMDEGHLSALETACDADTVVTDTISGRPARFIRNRLIEETQGLEPVPFPAQGALTGHLAASGNPDMGALYAGQSAALSRPMPAADLVRTLAEETQQHLERFVTG